MSAQAVHFTWKSISLPVRTGRKSHFDGALQGAAAPVWFNKKGNKGVGHIFENPGQAPVVPGINSTVRRQSAIILICHQPL